MQYALFIRDSSMHGEALPSAGRFAAAAVARGHRIRLVFFHGDAVWAVAQPDASGYPALDRLVALARAEGFPLLACQAAVERLGATVAGDAPLRMGSLGQWADVLFEVDRVMEFCA
ncbi:MAG: DsrE family protein [Lysobacterales bacterium]